MGQPGQHPWVLADYDAAIGTSGSPCSPVYQQLPRCTSALPHLWHCTVLISTVTYHMKFVYIWRGTFLGGDGAKKNILWGQQFYESSAEITATWWYLNRYISLQVMSYTYWCIIPVKHWFWRGKKNSLMLYATAQSNWIV